MPKFKSSLKDQQSTSGIQVSVGEISASDIDNISYSTLMQDYTDMRNGDPIISGILEFLKLPILQTDYRIDYDPGSKIGSEIAEFLTWTFDNLYDGFQSFKYHSLLAIEYGNAIFEYVWNYGQNWNGRVVNQLVRLSPIQNYTIHEYYFNDLLELTGLKLYRYDKNGSNELIDVCADKLFINTHNQEFGDIRGRSILRPMRKYWIYKQALIDSGTRLTQRGGIPHIQHAGNDDKTQAKARMIGQSMGIMKNAYITSEMDKIKIDLMDVKGQENLLPLLEYTDKQTFYGTLSQFMMSGIGQNGSRSATSEHKSSYELMAGYILNEFEECINYKLIPKILKNSPFAFIDVTDIPYFRFNSISSIDIQKVAPNIISLYNTNLITKTKDDEVFIRDMFGLPEIQVEEITTKITPPAMFSNKKEYRALSEFESKVFNFESAVEHFETVQEKAEKVINNMTEKIIADMVLRFKRGEKTITPRYQSEFISKLQKIYNEGADRGFKDVEVEISKLEGKKELSIKLTGERAFNSFLVRSIKKYFSEIQFYFEDELDFNKDVLSTDKSKVDDFFTGIDEKFKTRKREIINKVQSSYNDGRGEAMKDLPIKKWVYSAILDGNVCDVCRPFDGREMTKKEIDDSSLRFFSPVNKNCEGKDRCRCLLIASELE